MDFKGGLLFYFDFDFDLEFDLSFDLSFDLDLDADLGWLGMLGVAYSAVHL